MSSHLRTLWLSDVHLGTTAARAADLLCGHIHRPAIRRIGGICYANDGDWVEHRTAIGECADGAPRLMCWRDAAPKVLEKEDAEALAAA